ARRSRDSQQVRRGGSRVGAHRGREFGGFPRGAPPAPSRAPATGRGNSTAVCARHAKSRARSLQAGREAPGGPLPALLRPALRERPKSRDGPRRPAAAAGGRGSAGGDPRDRQPAETRRTRAHPAGGSPRDHLRRAPRSAHPHREDEPMTARTVAGLGLVTLLAVAGCSQPESDRVQGYVEGEFVYVAAPYAGVLETLSVQRGGQVSAK